MTTVDVRKVHCDRCKRVEEKPIVPFTGLEGGINNQQAQVWTGTTPTPVFTATILEDNTTVNMPATPRSTTFVDLCSPCKRTIAALLEQIGRRIDGLSPERAPRVAKKKEAASSSKAAPSTSSGAITPQQPVARPAKH